MAAEAEAAKAAQAARDAAVAARAREEVRRRQEAAAERRADRLACEAATKAGRKFRAAHGGAPEPTSWIVGGWGVMKTPDGLLWSLGDWRSPLPAKDGRPVGVFDPAAAAAAPRQEPGRRTNDPAAQRELRNSMRGPSGGGPTHGKGGKKK